MNTKNIFTFLLFLSLICGIFSCGLWLDKDIDGNDLASKIGGLDQCCGFCKSHPGCVAYSWKDIDGGTCFLKSATNPVVKKLEYTLGVLPGQNIIL